ncbi:MAG: CobW family GTP-binding protein [Myxococcota bacterium]
MSVARVPALVVSGFLGSGKTTLVAHLLARARAVGVRVAVITNEFGALGIDGSLLGEDGAGYVEIEGGCVCCQLSDELVRTLMELREQVDPDRIIVETSGVALPYDTQLHFWREPVSDWVSDCIACVVVDADRLQRERELGGVFEDQVTAADVLVLNKLDLVAPGEQPSIEARLRSIEPDAPLLHAVQGRVDPSALFGIAAPEPRPERSEPARHDHDAFEQAVIEMAPGQPISELRDRLRSLGALRVKGYVRTAEGMRLVQGVGERVEIQAPRGDPPEALVGRLVVIRRAPGDGAPRRDE